MKKLIALFMALCIPLSYAFAEKNDRSITEENEELMTSENAAVVTPTGDNIFEFEDYAPDFVANEERASGGKWAATTGGWTARQTISFTVTADQTDEYNVEYVGNMYNVHKGNISFWRLYVNNEEVYNIQSTAKMLPGSKDDDVLTLAKFSSESVTLKEGENTIKFVADICAASAGGVLRFGADYIRFYQQQDLEGFTAALDGYTKVGDTISPLLYFANGKSLPPYQYESVEYSTNDPKFIKITDTGIKAINYGYGEINIKLKREDTEYETTLPVYIASQNGLYIKSAEKSGNNVSFTVLAADDYTSEKANAVVVVYELKNGVKTLIDCYGQIQIEALSKGEEKTYVAEMESMPQNAYINIFLYDGKMTTNRAIGEYYNVQ